MRIGYGFDIHKFGGKGPIIICGVQIFYKQGLLAHSDGDVGLHAVIDSLLGATALGDIGTIFPSSNILYKNINSRFLLKEVLKKIFNKRYKLGNLDITIIAQKPNMSLYIPKMKKCLIKDFNCNKNDINIKAKTTDKLGFIGNKKGIAVESVVLLKNIF